MLLGHPFVIRDGFLLKYPHSTANVKLLISTCNVIEPVVELLL